MGEKRLILILVLTCVITLAGPSRLFAQGTAPSTYLEAAAQVINENDRIDAELSDIAKNGNVTIRPIHVVERLKKANMDAYANWPNLFNKEVPDKYADLYFHLKKLVKLQMKKTCNLYDAAYYSWMDNRDKAMPFREALQRIKEDYGKEKKLVEKIYQDMK
ncbi:MAG: hypothetical protein RDV48_17620 [Candidatus Eremiobacteraeota bacterium]|nr:hypothetical protein [Candidatus Eremiobacteraeota bacterium]